ncbi:MAG: hypothetical protein ACYC6W_03410 [Nitrosotalea sp.]
MKSKKTLLAIPLMVIAVIAIGFGMTSNVFAQSTASTTPEVVDQPDGPDNVQAADNGTDNQKDGETADDHNSAKEGPNGDGEGEQKDQTELKK